MTNQACCSSILSKRFCFGSCLSVSGSLNCGNFCWSGVWMSTFLSLVLLYVFSRLHANNPYTQQTIGNYFQRTSSCSRFDSVPTSQIRSSIEMDTIDHRSLVWFLGDDCFISMQETNWAYKDARHRSISFLMLSLSRSLPFGDSDGWHGRAGISNGFAHSNSRSNIEGPLCLWIRNREDNANHRV